MSWGKKLKLLSCIRLFATPWIVAYQASPSMGFSRQQYWSGLPFPSPGNLPDPGIEPTSPALAGRFFTSETPGKPYTYCLSILYIVVYISGSHNCNLPLYPFLSHLVTTCLFSISVSPFLFCIYIHFYCFLDSTYK